MDSSSFELIANIVGQSYRSRSENAMKTREKEINVLLRHRKLPDHGWDDALIELFLHNLSMMDCNNFQRAFGVGEREGRCYSGIVRRRNFGLPDAMFIVLNTPNLHFSLCHGIGRSGAITSLQPKATGSSLINRLTNSLALHAIQLSGVKDCKSCFVIPCATGMAMMLCLLHFRKKRPNAQTVIWSRIDQKTCIKCILAAGDC
ncbi:unnamed protein product [Soboliphyme baturini]|uniref:O-phosphoseryl-tRNA(Sec) selenium transferase n=1 Tax=Soboliphyme baturini TaxID=241478 RepID=A0A183IG00_9BILA|nr:unnamed protein product [Soboliphyme baturini]